MKTSLTAVDYDARAKLKKLPSLKGERISKSDGAVPYTVVEAPLADCVRRLLSKPGPTRHLYEIHAGGDVLSAEDALALHNKRSPPEEDLL